MSEEMLFPVSRACRGGRLARAAYYRTALDRGVRDGEVIAALNELVATELRWGFWKCYERLRQMGRVWNHKRVNRIYCDMRLNQKRRTKRRLPKRDRQPLFVPNQINTGCALHFMHDTLSS